MSMDRPAICALLSILAIAWSCKEPGMEPVDTSTVDHPKVDTAATPAPTDSGPVIAVLMGTSSKFLLGTTVRVSVTVQLRDDPNQGDWRGNKKTTGQSRDTTIFPVDGGGNVTTRKLGSAYLVATAETITDSMLVSVITEPKVVTGKLVIF